MCDSNNCGCSTHEDSKGCGCGTHKHSTDNNSGSFDDYIGELVTLTLDNNKNATFMIVNILQVSTKKYIVLIPLSSDDNLNEENVYLYEFDLLNAEPIITKIETDDEYEIAVDAYHEWLDELEFDEMQAALDED